MARHATAAPESASTASFGRRLLSLVYETLLLAAALFASALLFLPLGAHIDPVALRPLFQCYLLLISGGYFIWQWCHGGQTLPMKTWRLRLVTHDGGPLTMRHGVVRFLFALMSLALCGGGFIWALVDRDRLFLHDRLAGTRIVRSVE